MFQILKIPDIFSTEVDFLAIKVKISLTALFYVQVTIFFADNGLFLLKNAQF